MGFVVKAVKSVVKFVGSVVGGVVGLLIGGGQKAKTAGASTNTNLRLNKSLVPETYCKIVFGNTASANDLRYWQVWGSTKNNYDEVIALAGHRINAVKGTYFENELAFDANGLVQGLWTGVVSRDFRLGVPGQTAMSVADGTKWNASSTFDGVAHMKLAWLPTQEKLPNGVPSRYTTIVEGALVYDPRRDSTVPGGSGTHRINDQTTWSYSTLDSNNVPIGRNNALQCLWYLIGWRVANVQTGEAILRCGRGVDVTDINLSAFIAGANACEAAGYYTDCILSTEDAHTNNEDKLTAGGLIAQLIDTGGLWSYYANVNDTANVAIYITDDDIIDEDSVEWNQFRSIAEQYQQVGGKFIDPSINALFQLNGYPTVRDTNYELATGMKRRKSQDYEVIQDSLFAQKMSRLLLNMGQFQGELQASFFYRAMKAQVWDIVSYSSERFGWTKLFRVWRHQITGGKGVAMLLREVDATIWSAGSVTAYVAPYAGTNYDPRQKVNPTGVLAYSTTATGTNGLVQDGFVIDWDTPPPNVAFSEVQYRLSTNPEWQGANPAKGYSFFPVIPAISGATYNYQVRWVTIHNVPSDWIAGPDFTVGNAANVPWSSIAGITKPADNATRNDDGSGNALPASVDLSQATFSGAASLVLGVQNGRLGDRYKIDLNGVNAAVNFNNYKNVPVTPGERLVARVIGYSDTNNGDTYFTRVTFYRVNGGALGTLNLGGMQFFASEMVNTWVVHTGFVIVPFNAAFAVLSVLRTTYTAGHMYVAEPYLGRQEPNATFGSPAGTPVDLTTITAKPTNGSDILPTNWNIGIKAVNQSGFGLSDTDNTGTVTINVAATTWQLDKGTLINYPAASLPGLAYSTLYYIYRNDPLLNGGTSYASSTTVSNAVGSGKVYIGYWTTRGSGGAGVGGGGGGGCITPDMFVMTKNGAKLARELQIGDELLTIEADLKTVTFTAIEALGLAFNECVELETEHAKLRLSINTPMLTEEGDWTIAANAWLANIPTWTGGLHYEPVDVTYVGRFEVVKIHCGNGIFAAGSTPDEMIFSHNALNAKV